MGYLFNLFICCIKDIIMVLFVTKEDWPWILIDYDICCQHGFFLIIGCFCFEQVNSALISWKVGELNNLKYSTLLCELFRGKTKIIYLRREFICLSPITQLLFE